MTQRSISPPGFIAVVKASTGRECHVNGEKICAYGSGTLEEARWIALAGRRKLLWVSDTMEEIAQAIAAAFPQQ